MPLIDELERLSQLHQQGRLSDDEYARAKARLIDGGPTLAAGANGLTGAVNALRRSRSDRWLGGVCGGLAPLTGLAAWAWRLIFVLMLCFAGTGVLLYVLMWVLVPEDTGVVDARPSATPHAG